MKIVTRSKKTCKIEIPRPLYEKIKKLLPILPEKDITTVVIRAIDEYLSNYNLGTKEKPNDYSDKEEEQIKARLKALGYL